MSRKLTKFRKRTCPMPLGPSLITAKLAVFLSTMSVLSFSDGEVAVIFLLFFFFASLSLSG